MANQKISQLSNAAALTGTEQVPVVQSGATVKTTTQNIGNLALPTQSGQSGKYLQTNGTTASWQTVASPLPTFGVVRVTTVGGNVTVTTLIPYSSAITCSIVSSGTIFLFSSTNFTFNTIGCAQPGYDFTLNQTLIARQAQTSYPAGFMAFQIRDLADAPVNMNNSNTGTWGLIFTFYN